MPQYLHWVSVLALLACVPGAAAQEAEDTSEFVEAEEEKAPAWNVDDPPGERYEQPIDCDEGTWMSLDVSPDGREIVFDLLGDLYIMPITGGEAKSLTSGVAWDMQPRFSPDGSMIAFTSDRTGKGDKAGDNVWVIDRDGSDPRQITKETFRLLNGPVWHPSGEYIVARKHFTSRRSLGSGEMWMYHVSGVEGGASAGLQLTEKPTDQKDVNEPVFSPDAKYLYYSEDVWGGQTFQYNKDSNQQIYVVNRLELETGENERYITGPGGACRPTPSPDGELIAFVRRHDGKSALHLYDTDSGAVSMIYDDLERDMQEAWAIHGVYPAFAWTPDGKSIVFWARGKVRRLDLASGEAEMIPFRVSDTRTIFEPVRYPQEVAPEEVDIRMLRWVAVSPTGGRVAYQALGHIYLKDLPDGTPRRLTKQDKHFEFYPSWSRDGESIVYTTWHDQKLGSVRIADVDSGASRALVEDGHYVTPVFSPDGESVVYRRIGGGWLRSPTYSRDQGIYRVSAQAGAQGGEPELITKSGADPQFADDPDLLYVTRTNSEKDADNRTLVAIELAGEDAGREHELYKSTWATDYALSPDGAWIAFVERFNVHVAPFVRTGRTIKIGPKSDAVPLAKAASDAGDFVHFSGDSGRLHWSLGPTLYTRELSDSFAFLDGAPDELPEPTEEGVRIGFSVPHDNPGSTIALVGGRVVTMNGDEVIEDGVVVIEGNRITAVGARTDIEIPNDAHTVDVSGQVVLPGYIEAHAHGAQATGGITPQQNWVDYVRLSFGVTTIHDPSNDTHSVFAGSEMKKAGAAVGPRTFSTGTILYGAAGSFKAVVDSLDDALFHLRRMKAVGAFSVKSYNQPRRDQRQQVLEAARQLEMLVVPEGGSTFMHNLTMIVDGHTGIEHTFPVEIVYDDVLDLWKPAPGWTPVGYTPTLSVAYGGLSGEYWWYEHDEVWKNPRVERFVPSHMVEPRARRRQKAPESDYNHFLCARICKQAIDLGVYVQPGGHGQLQGLNTHWEMWMMTHGGMSPFEALRSGTLHAAKHLGLDGDVGSIEVGKLADIVVIEEGRDPLVNIRDSEHVEYVVANGRLFDARTMAQVHPESVEAEPFYWADENFSVGVTPPVHSGCAGCGIGGIGSWMEP